MRGTVIKRGNKWSVVIDLGRDPVTGKRRRDWHSGYATKGEAEDARIEILSRLKTGTYVEPSKQTLEVFLTDVWLLARRKSVAPTTIANYTHQLHSYVIPHLGHRPLQAISPGELTAFYAGLLENGKRQGNGGLSPTSVKNVHSVLRKALGDAVKWNLIARNPASNAEPPKATRSRMETWTADQVRLFLDAERDSREYALWTLAATTGMRRGEVLGLPWSAVDLDTGRLSVVQTLVLAGGVPTFRSEAKTASGRRPVELDQHTVRVLREHRRRQTEERLRAGTIWEDHGLVFARTDGTPVKPEWVSRVFKERAGRAGLPPIRFHDLRHTWATLALSNNVHPKVVQERLGHSNISVTLDTYSHVVPAMDRDAAEQVAALFV